MDNSNNNSQILIYEASDGQVRVDVRLEDETVWLTQEHMAVLFGKSKKTISEHINNIFKEAELNRNVVIRKFRTTTRHGAIAGKTQSRDVHFYNLDMIISVGYRVKSHQGTQFRIWAISQKTAAELVHTRINASSPLLGMQSYDKNHRQIKKSDVSIAKNFLNEDEIKLLGLLVEQYLAFAETMAHQHTPMYMKDWAERLDVILQVNGRELLTHAGQISHQMALEKAESEYKEYKQQQYEIEHDASLKELVEDIEKVKKLPK